MPAWLEVLAVSVGSGALAGLLVGYTLVVATRWPADGGSAGQRTGRIIIGGFLFVALGYLTDRLLEAGGWQSTPVPRLAAALLVVAATLAGAVVISRRLGLIPGTGYSTPEF